MSKVVERGVARCPRCVAIADYSFIEDDADLVRYEVACRRCGELYVEQTCSAPLTFSTEVERYVPPEAPRPKGVPLAGVVSELHRWWTSAAGAATRARVTVVRATTRAWTRAMARDWTKLRAPAHDEYTAIGSGH